MSDLLTTLAGNAESAEVSTDVFVQWVEGRIPRLVELIAQPKPADDAVRLAGLLDRNSDFAVSDQELQQAVVSLRFRDLDDDETFTISELVPYRDPRSRNAAITPDVASLPFFLMTDVSSTERVVDRILEQYGREGRVRREQLRVPGRVWILRSWIAKLCWNCWHSQHAMLSLSFVCRIRRIRVMSFRPCTAARKMFCRLRRWFVVA